MRNLLMMALVAPILVSCGKKVTYKGGIDPLKGELQGTIYCVTNCDELGGDTKKPKITLRFEQRTVAHNQQMCSSFRLHGSIGKTDLGCNDAPLPPVEVESKLRDSGDCQRVSFYTEVANPGNFNVNQHPGHYETCQQSGPHIWIDIEDHAGVLDFNDSTVDVHAVSGEALEWLYDDDKLFICVQ